MLAVIVLTLSFRKLSPFCVFLCLEYTYAVAIPWKVATFKVRISKTSTKWKTEKHLVMSSTRVNTKQALALPEEQYSRRPFTEGFLQNYTISGWRTLEDKWSRNEGLRIHVYIWCTGEKKLTFNSFVAKTCNTLVLPAHR